MSNTEHEYNQVIDDCKQVFINKMLDYGSSWRVLRPISIVDQIYIKAQRIRNVQQIGNQKVEDTVKAEWKGIVNYGIIALIQEELQEDENLDLEISTAEKLYDKHQIVTFELMQNKNHDYGEAWRNMSQDSFADLILTKILRIKQIIANQGITNISEGRDANFRDIINYAVFALILEK